MWLEIGICSLFSYCFSGGFGGGLSKVIAGLNSVILKKMREFRVHHLWSNRKRYIGVWYDFGNMNEWIDPKFFELASWPRLYSILCCVSELGVVNIRNL